MGINARKLKWGLIFIAAGTLLLANNYGLLSFEIEFSRDWPAILIAIGLLGAWEGIFHRGREKPRQPETVGSKKTIKEILEKIERGEMTAEEGAQRMKD